MPLIFKLLLHIYGISFLLIIISSSQPHGFSRDDVKEKFLSKFHTKCESFPFYKYHIDMLENPREQYVEYVFADGRKTGGGLGDRLGGLISAYAFAVRYNRTFFISGDKSFTQAFQPFHPSQTQGEKSYLDSYHSHQQFYTWDNLSWTKLQSHPKRNKNDPPRSIYYECVNPRPGNRKCALEANVPQQVLRFRGNRAYICRWSVLPGSVDPEELKKTLGVQSDTDLFTVAGCILRLAMWPTPRLWKALDEAVYRSGFIDKAALVSNKCPLQQIGFHFRCGDSSFIKSNDNENTQSPSSIHNNYNSQCVYNMSSTWRGTNFADDFSIDSPIEMGECGIQVAYNLTRKRNEFSKNKGVKADNTNILMYVASDYIPSKNQIIDRLSWPLTLQLPGACHIDSINSRVGDDCSLSSITHWFLLALSDKFILQALRPINQLSSYRDRITPDGDVNNSSSNNNTIYRGSKSRNTIRINDELAPISAFSRYAVLYSLSTDAIHYGSKCESIDTKKLSRQTQGNWVCNPKIFF